MFRIKTSLVHIEYSVWFVKQIIFLQNCLKFAEVVLYHFFGRIILRAFGLETLSSGHLCRSLYTHLSLMQLASSFSPKKWAVSPVSLAISPSGVAIAHCCYTFNMWEHGFLVCFPQQTIFPRMTFLRIHVTTGSVSHSLFWDSSQFSCFVAALSVSP